MSKWSSYKEAQLMTESWRRFLEEGEEESLDEGLKQRLASLAAAGALGAAAVGGGGPSSTPPQTDPTAELGDPVRRAKPDPYHDALEAEEQKALKQPRIFPDGSKRLQPLYMQDLYDAGKISEAEMKKFFKEEIKWINIAHKDIGTDRMDAFRAVAEPDGKWHSAFGGPNGNWNEERGGPVEHETGIPLVADYEVWARGD